MICASAQIMRPVFLDYYKGRR